MSQCPDRQELARIVAGDSTPDREAELEQHLDSCAACRDSVEQLDQDEALRWNELMASSVAGGGSLHASTHGGQAASTDAWNPAPSLGTLGHFVLQEELGRGAMGVVYRAWDDELKDDVAIKVLASNYAQDDAFRERFRHEAQKARQVRSPNVVTIYSIGEAEDGAPYLVMELIEGQSLDKHIASSRNDCDASPDPREAAEMIRLVAKGLAAIHERGIVHRDIKSANILVSSEGPKIADLGLARPVAERTLDSRLEVAGTPAYMSPEHYDAPHRVNARSDLFSLGVVFYELLVGERPFRASTIAALRKQIQVSQPQSPRAINDRIPRDLETIALKCLRPEPAHRYHSAEELAEDLRRFLHNEPITARPVGTVERLVLRTRRNPVAAGLLAFIVLLLLGFAIVGPLVAWQQTRLAEAATLAEQDANRSRDEAQRQQELAEKRFQDARAILSYLTDVAANQLGSQPQTAEVRRQILARTLEYHQQFLADASDDPQRTKDVASAYFEIAWLSSNLGRMTEAAEAYDQAAEAWLQVREQNPAEAVHQLANVRNNQSNIYLSMRQFAKAEAAAEEAIGHWKELQKLKPGLLPQLRLVAAENHAGLLHRQQNHLEAAMIRYRKSRDLHLELLAEHPEHPGVLRGLSLTEYNIASLLDDMHEFEAAQEMVNHAIEHAEAYLAFSKSEGRDLGVVTGPYELAGLVQRRLGDPEGAIPFLEKTLGIHERILSEDPASFPGRNAMAATLHNLALAQGNTGRIQEAIDSFGKSIALRERLVVEQPGNLAVRASLGNTKLQLARVFQLLEEFEAARALCGQATELLRDVSQYAPELTEVKQNFEKAAALQAELEQALQAKNAPPP